MSSRTLKAGLARFGACLLTLVMPGCATGPRPGSTSAVIDQVHLLTTPVALSFDSVPGPDGFGARVYASNRKQSKPRPILEGTLEILLYDGVLKEGAVESSKPLRVWTYSAEDLKRFSAKTSVGAGYAFAPQWGEARPKHNRVSVIARYTNANGERVYSAPSSIPLTVK